MILSYLSAPFSPHDYGQPVVVMPRGEAIDATTWIVCEFWIVRASPEEREILARTGLV